MSDEYSWNRVGPNQRLYFSPYFEYYINLYDDLLKTKQKLSMLVDALNSFGGDQDKFVGHHFSLSASLMQSVKESSGYTKLLDSKGTEDMQRFGQQHAATKAALGSGVGGKLCMCHSVNLLNATWMTYFCLIGCCSAHRYSE